MNLMKLREYIPAETDSTRVYSCYPDGFEKMPYETQLMYDRNALSNVTLDYAVEKIPDAEIYRVERESLFKKNVTIYCSIPV